MPWTLTRYRIWVWVLTLAFGLNTLTVLGLLVRTGRLRTASGAALLVVGMLAPPRLPGSPMTNPSSAPDDGLPTSAPGH